MGVLRLLVERVGSGARLRNRVPSQLAGLLTTKHQYGKRQFGRLVAPWRKQAHRRRTGFASQGASEAVGLGRR